MRITRSFSSIFFQADPETMPRSTASPFNGPAASSLATLGTASWPTPTLCCLATVFLGLASAGECVLFLLSPHNDPSSNSRGIGLMQDNKFD